MIIILKTMIKYNIPKAYSEIIDIYPKDCIYILHKRPPYIFFLKKNL
jgi:hypothetical protein